MSKQKQTFTFLRTYETTVKADTLEEAKKLLPEAELEQCEVIDENINVAGDISDLLNKAANQFREKYFDNDVHLILHYIDEAEKSMNPIGYGVNPDEEEYHGYIEELNEFFNAIANPNPKREKKAFGKFYAGLSWENFEQDEQTDSSNKEYYSLGSMFWNKLTWISEGSSNEDAVKVAEKLVDHIKPVMDYYESKYIK